MYAQMVATQPFIPMPAPLTAAGRRMTWAARTRLARRRAYLRLARLRYPDNVVGPDTELVVDGAMRTASTFAVVAFQLAQPRPVRVAHHLHAPAQVLEAVRRRVPALVTIRAPEETVLSTAVWEPHIGVEGALVAYVGFYAAPLPHRSGMVVGAYDRVTSDLGSVIDAVNARFGTEFARFDPTPEAVAECFAIIDDRARRPPWDAAIGRFMSGLAGKAELDAARAAGASASALPHTRVARPSADRQARKEALRSSYHDPALAALRARAEELHESFRRER
jgi:hypothetical protein